MLYTSSYSFLHGKYLFVWFKDNSLYMFTDRFICYYVFSCVLFVACSKNNYKKTIQLSSNICGSSDTTDIACVLFTDSVLKCV